MPGHPYLEKKHSFYPWDTEISFVIDLRLNNVTEKVNGACLSV